MMLLPLLRLLWGDRGSESYGDLCTGLTKLQNTDWFLIFVAS